MRMRTLSPAARLLFFAAICGGVAAAAIRIPDVAHWHGTDVLALGGLAAAILVTELFSVPLRLPTETPNFMLTDAAYIARLIPVPPRVLRLRPVAGGLAGRRR